MAKYLKQFLGPTPQHAPIPGTNQIPNSAGGYVWGVDHWQRLQRFLILGSEGGSYYASERKLTAENVDGVLACLQEDGVRAVREIVAISDGGRAPKNDPAVFALALAAGLGDEATRKAALEALPRVCRTGTHLFQFAGYIQTMRGWGRGLRRGVAGWYQALSARSLAYQLVKYRQREGWTHADLLRLAHPTPDGDTRNALFRWVTQPEAPEWTRAETAPEDDALAFVWAFMQAQNATDVNTIVRLIEQYDLPREALPTQFLNKAAVWDALLAKMPMTAMLRNLGVMGRVGLLRPMSDAAQVVVERLGNGEALRKARIHPIAVLSALRVYAQGHGFRGEGSWPPVPSVVDALDAAFYTAFGNVTPANKRMLLALDVSGSMAGGMIAGVPGLTPRDGSAAMALVTAKTEPKYDIVAFQQTMLPLSISPGMRLDDAVKAVSNLPFAGTDCAQPMLYALEKRLAVDMFVIYTDSETWFGKIHPAQALRQYRDTMGIAARLNRRRYGV